MTLLQICLCGKALVPQLQSSFMSDEEVSQDVGHIDEQLLLLFVCVMMLVIVPLDGIRDVFVFTRSAICSTMRALWLLPCSWQSGVSV